MPNSVDSPKRRRSWLSPFVVAMAIIGATCGGSPTAPRGSKDPGSTERSEPAAFVTVIRIGTSALVLRVPGETGQLTVEAFLSTGGSVDRTVEAEWTSQDTSVATVAPGGLVTAVGLGATHIDAVVDGKRSTVDVVITPPGTFATLGVVREPGSGPLAGVLVREIGSNRSATTDQNGEFRFAALQQARFRIARDGFEVVELDATSRLAELSNATIPRLSVDIPLQRIVRLAAGTSGSQLTIASDDVGYNTGFGYCQPCKLVRVTTGRTGTLRVIVTPQGTPNPFYVWIDGRRFALSGSNISAQTAVAASSEALVYIGRNLTYYDDDFAAGSISFGITTSIDEQ